MGRTIIVANQKGGVGKTTTIVNLASYIAEAGRTTLVVDLDSQGNSCSGLGIHSARNQTSLYEVLLGLESIDEIVTPTKIPNLSIVPSNINMSGAQVEMVDLEQREHRLSAALDPLRDRYEYIFIDSPPSKTFRSFPILGYFPQRKLPSQARTKVVAAGNVRSA